MQEVKGSNSPDPDEQMECWVCSDSHQSSVSKYFRITSGLRDLSANLNGPNKE